jgi:hypothetical protein
MWCPTGRQDLERHNFHKSSLIDRRRIRIPRCFNCSLSSNIFLFRDRFHLQRPILILLLHPKEYPIHVDTGEQSSDLNTYDVKTVTFMTGIQLLEADVMIYPVLVLFDLGGHHCDR